MLKPALVAFSILAFAAIPQNSSDQFAFSAHRVNLVLQVGETVWKDPRGPLNQKAAELGLSQEEVQRIRETTGYVFCPGYQSGGPLKASAIIVGNGSSIATDAHVFIEKKTNVLREPLSECLFINQADSREVVKLDFSNQRTHKFYSLVPVKEFYNDRAIVRLAKKIAKAKPFSVDRDGTAIQTGDKLIMISAEQERMTVALPQYHTAIYVPAGRYEMELNKEPIAQQCTAVQYYPSTTAASSVLYSDCNSTEGASGSVILVRNKRNELVAKALHVQGGLETADFKPLHYGGGIAIADLSFALAVGLDSEINNDIAAIEQVDR